MKGSGNGYLKASPPARGGLRQRERLILALDVGRIGEAEALVERLRDYVGAFKVGSQLYTAHGPKVVELIHEKKGRVFLDLKFHDIPSTVGAAAAEVARLGVFMFNLHASGGLEMMKKAIEATKKAAEEAKKERPLVVAVTVLTSLDKVALRLELGVGRSLKDQVIHLAKMAQRAGLNGVVASPQEIQDIRAACGQEFLIITPGVRPPEADLGDQKRVMTPAEAISSGANFIVVGRPILEAPDPVEATQRILEDIAL